MPGGCLQQVKNSEKWQCRCLKEWSRSLMRGRSNCRALTGKNLVFWMGDRLREVVAHGGSTVFFIRFSFSSDERVNKDWLQCS